VEQEVIALKKQLKTENFSGANKFPSGRKKSPAPLTKEKKMIFCQAVNPKAVCPNPPTTDNQPAEISCINTASILPIFPSLFLLFFFMSTLLQ